MARTRFRLVVLLVATLALCSLASPLLAQTFQPVFTNQYTRQAGTPVTTSDAFTACDPRGTFRIVVLNGPGGLGRISAGSIFLNGLEVIHEQDFNQQVAQITRPVTNLLQDNRLDVRLRSGPGAAIQVTVEGIQACGVRITSPASGSTLTEPVVLVRGTAPAPRPGGEVGVTVNGIVALVASGQFASLVPVDADVTSLTAIATDGTTTFSTDTIPVTVQLAAPDSPPLLLRAQPAIGLAPLQVSFSLASSDAFTQIALDLEGNGSVDFRGVSLDGQVFTYGAPGLYLPTVIVTDPAGATRTATALVRVYDPTDLNALLQAKWQAMKNALRRGDIAQALTFIVRGQRATYRQAFTALGAQLANIDQILTDIHFVEQRGLRAEYQMIRLDDGIRLSYFVIFLLDEDGIWRINFL